MTTKHNPSEYPPEDVLVKSLFHKALLFFHIPATWGTGRVIFLLLLPLAAVWLTWSLAAGQTGAGFVASGLMALFFLGDALLLKSLPAIRVSFGPWQPQLFALAVPRTLAALFLCLFLLITTPLWATVALLSVQLLGSLALAYGALVEPLRLEMTCITVESDHLAPDVQPVKILHISDLHVERLTRREDKLLALIEEAQADLVLITGDYLNLSYTRDPKAQTEARRLLAQISAPYGVYAVLGSPPVDERDVAPALFEGLPVSLLVNESRVVDLGDQRQIVLLGLDCSHYLPADADALSRLVAASPNHQPRVLLYHAPDLMPEAAGHGLDLYLCGHTHGGQVRLPFYGAILTSSQLGKRYEMGLYQELKTHLYVSRGVGLEGLSAPRVRFLAPPEITLVTLQGAKD